MDSTTQTQVIRDAVGAGVMSPNEGRSKLDLKPVEGGESPYLQQQNYSLSALAKRDAQEDPFAANTPKPKPEDGKPDEDEEDADEKSDEEVDAVAAKAAIQLKAFLLAA